jgi:glycosyltransferase involved in cell wall biosynthesis
MALRIIKKDVPDIRLIVGGEGELLEEYRTMSHRLDLNENVRFAGFIPEDRIVEYYNRADIFVMPSTDPTQEGFGMVLLEALACGTPVITTRIVGVSKEVRELGAGVVVEPGDVIGLAEAIKNLLFHKNRSQAMGTIGIKLARERYSWDIIAEKISGIYCSL